jgi:hypothetical protein
VEVGEPRLFWLPRTPDMFPSTKITCARWNDQYAGKPALDKVNSKGYYHGRIWDKEYLTHRVVFALYHGRWPDGQLDHADRNRLNNRLGNLREATQQQQRWNSATWGKASKFCGVSRKCGGSWQASCADQSGRRHYLGSYPSEAEAALAYNEAAQKWHGQFARLNDVNS